jgi:hypothetical protein
MDASGTGAWTKVYDESYMGRTSLAISPLDQNIVYALASEFFSTLENSNEHGLRAILKSTDGGQSWTSVLRGTHPPNTLNSVLLTNPRNAICYASYSSQGWYDNVIAVDPVKLDPANPDKVWAGGIDLFRSDDGGQNWGIGSTWWADRTASQYAHGDQHVIVFHPNYNGDSNKTMYVCSDGGIFQTDNARAATGYVQNNPVCNQFTTMAWTSLNHNFAVTQFYHGAVYPDGSTYFGGTQDNGTIQGADSAGSPGINAWSTLLGGDGGYVAVDPTNTDNLYAEIAGNGVVPGGRFRKYNKFLVEPWATDVTPPESGFLFVSPFVMDPSAPQRLWTGGRSLWRSDNGAASWSQVSTPIIANDGISADVVTTIAVSPMNPNQVLAGTFLGQVCRTSSALCASAGTQWNSALVRNSGDFISCVTFDPLYPNTAYATVSTFNHFDTDHHVYKSTDRGATWFGIDGSGLTSVPDVPVHCIVVDPNNSSTLYIGTDLGVLVSTDGGATWNKENTGFVNAPTEWLTFNTVGGVTSLFAFTHGRGVWRVAVSTATNNVALAANGATATSSGAFSAAYPDSAVNDGDRTGVNWGNGGGWNDNSPDDFSNDWVEIDFNGSKTIDEIDVFTLRDNFSNPAEPTQCMTFSAYGITAFDVQYWNGSWANVPHGSVTGNNLVWRKFNFPSITTSKIRIVVKNALLHNSRIVEIEAYQAQTVLPNVALASNGGMSTSSGTFSSAFPESAVNDGDRTGGNWGNGGGWNDNSADDFSNDWMEIDFSGSKTIQEIDVFTLQDNYSNGTEPSPCTTFSLYGITDFNVQYWDGSAWVNVPCGSVSGNNLVWRKLIFSSITTSKIKVVVHNALLHNSRIVEIEAY